MARSTQTDREGEGRGDASSPGPGVFAGVKVVELAQWVFVPVAGALLCDWGAEVIKVESPSAGDPYRGLVEQGVTTGSETVNYSVELANRGKRSIGLDLKSAEGRDIFYALIADADVFLTNFRSTALDRLGLSVETLREINPRLIYARGHGFGVRGPDKDVPAYDNTAFWSRGGMAHVLTPESMEHPLNPRGAFGDRQAAMNLAFGVSSALFRRERTGDASVVDVSLLGSAMWTLGSDMLGALQGQMPRARTSRGEGPNPLGNVFRTKDGRHITLALLQPDRYWPELCSIIGREDLLDDDRLSTMASRAHNRSECLRILDEIFADRTYSDWVARFERSHLPWAPVQSVEEVLTDPQVVANDYLSAVEFDDGIELTFPNGPVQFDETPPVLRRAPAHGADTEDVLLGLGFDWDRIIELKLCGAIL
ncbi:CaiB/BaiF CoA transferase family protein [Rhodococcus sp. P1Y]|uniref:CaiB/BaiF CoA transferase family protein n=1 Tax=Rhodococcus sp. P1Y TaxID=1302308 RepID=UPI000EB0C2EB|nr:CoA transferase [Rhodococcus sp. P1Y]AYJ50375.1 CoA transferase [Rhodococcus sp. P1Y]